MKNMKSKLITILFFIVFVSNANAQLPKDEITGKVVFTDVVQLEGMTTDEIYKKAKLWVVSTLKSGDNMVELSGVNSDQIIGTGNIKLVMDKEERKWFKIKEGYMNFKFVIFCKDGRLKYNVENFHLFFKRGSFQETNTSLDVVEDLPTWPKKLQPKYKEFVSNISINNVNTLVNDFVKFMQTEENNDW